jgi:ribosomal protein L31E
MGSILDSAEEIRQDQGNTPGQAHGSEAELEKDKAQGLRFIGKDINIRYYFPCLYPEDFNKFHTNIKVFSYRVVKMAGEQIERTYNIPLRRDWLHVPRYKRAKKAVRAAREFIAQHMKVEEKDIRIGKFMNQEIWQHGIKNPPHHIKIIAKKDKDGKVSAEIVGAPVEEKKEEKKAKPAKEEAKAEEKPESKDADVLSEEKKAPEKPEAPKPKKEKKE